jgi:hypothetical protein
METETYVINVVADGDRWSAHYEDFENLQESPVGFGATRGEAVKALLDETT